MKAKKFKDSDLKKILDIKVENTIFGKVMNKAHAEIKSALLNPTFDKDNHVPKPKNNK